MPIRNGKVVPWKYRCNIKRFLNDDSLTDSEKLIKISELIEANEEIFMEDHDCFASDLREAAGWADPDEIEEEGNYVLDKLYDYADRQLIWLGI